MELHHRLSHTHLICVDVKRGYYLDNSKPCTAVETTASRLLRTLSPLWRTCISVGDTSSPKVCGTLLCGLNVLQKEVKAEEPVFSSFFSQLLYQNSDLSAGSYSLVNICCGKESLNLYSSKSRHDHLAPSSHSSISLTPSLHVKNIRDAHERAAGYPCPTCPQPLCLDCVREKPPLHVPTARGS